MTAATATRAEQLLHPDPAEAEGLAAVRDLLEVAARGNDKTRLVGPSGLEIELPNSAFDALTAVVESLAKGQTITLIPHVQELTTQQAADILHVSRPHLVKLVDHGVIPHRRVGTHRRLNIDDVLRYRAERAAHRRRELAELTRMSEEIGYE